MNILRQRIIARMEHHMGQIKSVTIDNAWEADDDDSRLNCSWTYEKSRNVFGLTIAIQKKR